MTDDELIAKSAWEQHIEQKHSVGVFEFCGWNPCTTLPSADRRAWRLDNETAERVDLGAEGEVSRVWLFHSNSHQDKLARWGLQPFENCTEAPCHHLDRETRRRWRTMMADQAAAKEETPDDLEMWWVGVSRKDIANSIGKIREYGGSGPAHDLVQVGDLLARLSGWDEWTVEDATELGILFYLRSKIARWEAAVLDRRRPSDDTLYDITYYSMMARRNRIAGGWPEGPK